MIGQRIFSPFQANREENNIEIPPALRRANELTVSGNYAASSIIFEQLARSAEARKGPRAPFLYIQAGTARLLLGQSAPSLAHFKHALNMLIESGRFTLLYRLGSRIIKELKARGLTKEAQEIGALIHSNTPAIAEMPTERGPMPSATALPAHCPACGGPVHADEVEWLNASTGECPYCGSTLRNR
jgi:hypothetical protein